MPQNESKTESNRNNAWQPKTHGCQCRSTRTKYGRITITLTKGVPQDCLPKSIIQNEVAQGGDTQKQDTEKQDTHEQDIIVNERVIVLNNGFCWISLGKICFETSGKELFCLRYPYLEEVLVEEDGALHSFFKRP